MARNVGAPPKPVQTTPPRKSWRDCISIHPAAQLFPLLSETSPEELRALGESIRKNGLTSPVVIFRELNERGLLDSGYKYSLLDGRNRLDAMEAVGIPFTLSHDKKGTWHFSQPLGSPVELFESPHPVLFDGDPYEYVLAANIHRRHLTTELRLKLVDDLTKARPELSANQVAKMIKVSPTTAVKRRKKLEAAGDVSTVETSTDTKGRQQPRSKRPKPKATIPPPAKPESAVSGPAVDIVRTEPLLQPPIKPPTVDRRAEHTIVNGAPKSKLDSLLWVQATDDEKRKFVSEVGLAKLFGAATPQLIAGCRDTLLKLLSVEETTL